jgi:hypothetical protein
MKKPFLTALFLACTLFSFSQTPIEVASNTIKVPASGEQEFYYGFVEGDQVIFDLEEVNGKELKEFEIVAVSSTPLFLDYKTKKLENKILQIPETGIYKFRFANSNLISGRVCKYKIQRIPAIEETKKFNSMVYKRTAYDTIYHDVPERYLVKADTIFTEILNQTAKVHSQSNLNSSRTTTNFRLPDNTIFWSYYIGVDQAGQQAFEFATNQLASAASPIAAKFGASGPLVALALNMTSFLPKLQSGEDIDYYLVQGQNVSLFAGGQAFRYFKSGKVINDFARSEPIPGLLSFCFNNDNAIQGVSVTVKVVAAQLNATWETRQVRKMNITSREEMYLKN